MVRLVVSTARRAGLDPVVVVVPPEAEGIRQAVDHDVTFAVQERPLGSGDALARARSAAGRAETVVVLSGDVPLVRSETIQAMVESHGETGACVTLLSAVVDDPGALGRVLRDDRGRVTAVAEVDGAPPEVLAVREINGGVYAFHGPWLWDNVGRLAPSPSGEVYLTDLVALAVSQGRPVEALQVEDPEELLGVNDRVHLARAEGILRRRIRQRWLLAGVTMPDPATVYIDPSARLGRDTVIMPNTHILGDTRIGDRCEIGPNAIVRDSRIGDDCRIVSSVVEGSRLEEAVDVGPFSHIRPGSLLQRGVHVGNFAEVKKSRLGPNTKMGHFSYVGDADVGENVNIGAGTVTCNFDGVRKHRTRIGDGAFIGSDSMLVAPVTIGEGASTGAGSVVIQDVPPGAVVVGVPARLLRPRREEEP